MAAAGVPAELRVLLVPRSEQPRGAARVRLSRARHALGAVLLAGGIRLESLGAGGAGQRGSVLPGAWADFLWDSSEDDGSQSKTKLLALAQSHDLFVYEFSVEDGKHNPNSLHSCEAETLKRLLEDKNISLPSISSVKILSFGNNKCKLLLNRFLLVHLAFPGEGSPPEPCGCFPLALPAGAVGRIADSQFCRGILFLLDSAGWIYVFDCCDGASLGKVAVALGAGQGQGPAPVSPLAALAVSPDLSTAVVTSSCHWALAVQLNTYFRQFPEHLFCKRDPENLPVKAAEGLDEDELASSEHSMELLPLPFRTDRSWKAHLSSLWDRVRRRRTPGSANLVNDLNLPWYQFFTHLEDHDPEVCEDPERMVAFVPRAVTWAASPALQGQPGGAGQQWAQIPVGAAQDRVELECKLVTGAKAVFVGQAQHTGLALALWDFESQQVTCSHFGRSSAYVECSAELPLCLLLTERGLSLVLFGVTQEEFLTRLMMFGSAGVVDSLCRLNGWERCSIPIHALEAGLENRQLDTVDLFLKSKESAFSLSAACPGAAASQSYLRSVEELRPALNLLCSAIQGNDMEPHSKPFSEQLLNLTLTFLTKQLEEIFVHTEEPDEFLQKAADILTDYIIKLRKFLRRYPHPAVTPGQGAELDEDLPEIEESREWEKLTPEEVIAEAILSNKIPEAQIFFRRQKHPAESLQEFLQTGLSLVYDCLLRGSTREASELLRNMGLDVEQELHRICLHTQDRHVRELLVKVLQEENYFSEKEKKMIDFVHQVESFYSESFQENKETQALSRCSGWRRRQELAGPRAVLGSQLGWGSPRLTLSLGWALCWEPLLQDMVLLPWRAQRELKSCSAEVLWMHVTAQHDWLRVCSWIEESEPSQAPCASAAWPPLSPDIVDRSTLCSPYMRQDILNKLARKGIFVPSELEDFELLLQRLSCVGGVLQNPHPVPKYSSASGLDFHAQFVLHCLEHSLQYLLYTYLDYYSLTPANCPVLGNKELQEAHPWFEFLVQCRGVASNPRDPKMIFQASLANAQMLIPSSQGGVSSILLEGRTLLALATTVYGPGGIDQVLQNEDTEKPLKKVDPQLLKMALTPYPKLKAALFPSCTAHGILPPDISLYHLLQSLMPFDPTKLFGWQSTNTLAVSDAWSQLPHFSSPGLVSRHAVQERLHFLFYLRHGRPAFAFGTFLGQQLARSKAPRLLMQQAAREAQLLALSCFGVPSVAAACVCFLELLGQDSLGLRVALRAAGLISSHSPTRDSLVEKLTRLADGDKAAAAAVLTSLEEAFWDNIERQGMKRTSSGCSRQWSLVVQFCKLHSLELSTSFLRECAKANEWLQFLIQSQLHGHQPAQVVPLLQDFPAALQDHLQLALGRLLGAGAGAAARARAGSLFHTLLQCQAQPSPCGFLLAEGLGARAPVLSVLAACCPGANLISCLCVWVITSVDDATRAEATAHMQGRAEGPQWDLQDLAVIWKVFLRKQKSKTLLNGFQLFLKDSPLLHILEMYELCMNCKKYNEAKTKLDKFQESLTNPGAAAGAAPAVPLPWLRSQALFLLELMLQQCRTDYELGKLLQLLAAAESLLLDGPHLRRLCALSEALRDSSIPISRSILAPCSLEAFQGQCSSVLEQLQEKGMFGLAREVAALAELPVDSVVIHEVLRDLHHLRDSGQWHQSQSRAEFWQKCDDTFSRHCICSRAAAQFFLQQAGSVWDPSGQERTASLVERQLLLTLAGHWLAKEPGVAVQELQELEQQLWQCRVAQRALLPEGSQPCPGARCLGRLAEQFSFARLAALEAAEPRGLRALPARAAPGAAPGAAERAALGSLLGTLLEQGGVLEAARVCRYFQLWHRDVALALLCRALALGEAGPEQLQPEVQSLLSAEASAEPGASSLEDWTPLGCGDDAVVAALKALAEECVHGRGYCRQVLCLYELSKDLSCSFAEVSAREPREVLGAILARRGPERGRRAQAFITCQGLPPATVAPLLAQQITHELLASAQGKGQKQAWNPAVESQELLQLAKLCQDHTLVGMKLLEKISSVPCGELSCITELLILAHSLFSLTCHMEGITRVLQAARLLTEEHLAPREEYGLLVRLLTGIGRYNEMTYIFELLHQKHYFEVLMRKKLDPSGTLKAALLDYTKRCRPGDSEKHNMIALCFSMCREIGQNHEAAACTQLKLIECRPWEESLQDVPNLKKLLLKAVTLFIDAAESYSKDSCVRQALRCRRQTRLITLQLHFLGSGQSTRVINLGRQELPGAILALPRFYQAAIVAEAYEFLPDWAEVLFQQVITRGDFVYLEEFRQQRPLRPGLFEEVAKKVKQQQPPADAALRNLKRFLTHCEDIYTYYRLAYDHKFYDVVNSLLKDPQTGCCLNDLLSN
ncbi:spatacsin [Melozone crissalis]|uniref:spatacsin n=1 Tax=Melozone crissalis TaxID=40204 RepID=UPI0023DC0B52|nr:spatacsin [Melozone crissalis]